MTPETLHPLVPILTEILRGAVPGARPSRITQGEITRLLRLRQETLEAKDAAAKWEAALAAEEVRLKAALQAGATVERGRYRLTLETETTWRSVPWKKVVEEHLGKPFAEKVLADTPPGEREVLRVLQEVPVDGDAPGRGRGRGSQQDGR